MSINAANYEPDTRLPVMDGAFFAAARGEVVGFIANSPAAHITDDDASYNLEPSDDVARKIFLKALAKQATANAGGAIASASLAQRIKADSGSLSLKHALVVSGESLQGKARERALSVISRLESEGVDTDELRRKVLGMATTGARGRYTAGSTTPEHNLEPASMRRPKPTYVM